MKGNQEHGQKTVLILLNHTAQFKVFEVYSQTFRNKYLVARMMPTVTSRLFVV